MQKPIQNHRTQKYINAYKKTKESYIKSYKHLWKPMWNHMKTCGELFCPTPVRSLTWWSNILGIPIVFDHMVHCECVWTSSIVCVWMSNAAHRGTDRGPKFKNYVKPYKFI